MLRAWFIHGYLMGALAMFPGITGGDEGDPPPPEPEVWTNQGTQRYLSVSFSAPEGTTNVQPGSSRQLVVTVTEYTWELWTSNYGSSDNRNEANAPTTSAAVSLTLESGDASLSQAPNGFTDSNGQWTDSLVMGTQTSVVRAECHQCAVLSCGRSLSARQQSNPLLSS